MNNQSLKSQTISRYFPLILLACLALAVSGCNWLKRVSVSSAGEQGNNHSQRSSVSATGRYIAFSSSASNLVSNDLNAASDVFVHDTSEGTTRRVSVDSAGNEGNFDSGVFLGGGKVPSISADGLYVAFDSAATNLVATDLNGMVVDVYLHDRATATTTLVSVNNAGVQGNDFSYLSALSSDGRFVVFRSTATNLVPGDTNNQADIFVRDRLAGTTTRVSVDSTGNQANGSSWGGSISDDGRFIAFESYANNLVAGDTNGAIDSPKGTDIFVKDRITGVTRRVSVDSAGNQVIGHSQGAVISNNGRYVAFISYASTLVAGDTNSSDDVFVHDLITGSTTRVSVDSAGNPGNGGSYGPSISPSGRYVTFQSWASNLVAPDTNNAVDVFIHDRKAAQTGRVSLGVNGEEGDGPSAYASLSADGRYVVFMTDATNFVQGDNNWVSDIIIRAIPNVTVTSIVPHTLPIGATTGVTIKGTNFSAGATPLISGAQLDNIVIVDENTITTNVIVPASQPTGAQDVSVGLPGTGPGPSAGAVGTCVDCVTFSPKPSGC